jgi:hypothetical protein
MVKIIKKGIVTFAGFTCQPRDALMGRSQENQWLGELHGGAKALGNPLFLANVTMSGGLVLALCPTEGDR